MDDVLVIGGGPAGLLAAWVARQRGAHVRVLAAGIGTTHIMPGGLSVLDTDGDLRPALDTLMADHPGHPYALAGIASLEHGLDALRAVCEPAGLQYAGGLEANYRLPTALGAIARAALVPESFAAGDLAAPGEMLIAGPAGWRDFYPALCADNLARQGIPARAATFDLPEIHTAKFDATAAGLARLFDRAEVRARVAGQLRAALKGAARVGLPAIIGLERHREAWLDLQEQVGAAVFEIPTLPPSVPGMRIYLAFKAALARTGVPLLLDMPVQAARVEGNRATAVSVPAPNRDVPYRAGQFILATGGLYGGGITSDHRGELCEVVFGLPISAPAGRDAWFNPRFLPESGKHPIHYAGLQADREMRALDADGRVVLENVRVAGRLLAGYDPLAEGSTEGVWLATAYRAAESCTAL
jgi:glycerol-3-phosphate dehydrogenase subunit B